MVVAGTAYPIDRDFVPDENILFARKVACAWSGV